MNKPNFSHRELREPTALVVRWLQKGLCFPSARLAGDRGWAAICRAVTIQGLGPYLHTSAAGDPDQTIHPDFRHWLAESYRWNALRLDRIQMELAAIFRGAQRSGFRVMALKGGALIGGYYDDPALRPMADLDLLVRPDDLAGLATVLYGLGYRQISPESEQAAERHQRFDRPGSRVHSAEFEHPDNPIPVEVHTDLRVPLWGDVGGRPTDLDPWANAVALDVEGEKAWAPDPETLLLTLAFHHLQHLMVSTGRAIQWLDLCQVLSVTIPRLHPGHADWLYPALTLASRCFPGPLAELDLSGLRSAAKPVLVRWAERVPLDGRCGLNLGLPPDRRSRILLHWERWRPSPWRLALAYPAESYLSALGAHAIAIYRQLQARLRSALTLTG